MSWDGADDYSLTMADPFDAFWNSLPRRPLPHSRTAEGRLVWEPPILDYSDLIGEEYEKKREAVLKFTGFEAGRTTEILDANIEYDLLSMYNDWIDVNQFGVAVFMDRLEISSFFSRLKREVRIDMEEAHNEVLRAGSCILRDHDADGEWCVVEFAKADDVAQMEPLPTYKLDNNGEYHYTGYEAAPERDGHTPSLQADNEDLGSDQVEILVQSLQKSRVETRRDEACASEGPEGTGALDIMPPLDLLTLWW